MVTVALVGAAHIHTPGFVNKMAERSDIEARYVWDHDTARAEANAAKLPGSKVADLETIWNDKAVEAVVICSETVRHEDLVMPAAEHGKHLFVEKPLSTDAAAAYRMAGAIERAGAIFQTGYFQRGQRQARFIKQQIDAGSFGQITRARHSNCHAGAIGGWFDSDWRWMADADRAGVGGYGDLGTHSLDILLWWLGPVARVTGRVASVTGRYGEIDEVGEGLLEFESGVVATLAAGWVSHANPVRMEVSGTEGHAVVVGDELRFWSSHVDGADGKTWTDLPGDLPHAFDLFLDAVNGSADAPLIPVSHAAYCSSVMAAIYAGAESDAWVKPQASAG